MSTPLHSDPGEPGGEFLVASSISKRFGITQALDDVSVTFRRGEVHALMGENGAGKSTLGKVIAGLHRQDSGRVLIAAPGSAGGHAQMRELKPGSLQDAFDAGVRLVHQELAQCPNLSVAENLCLHDLPTNRIGLVNRRAMIDRAAALLAALEPSIDPRAPLGTLSPGHRQIVQIAGALDERRDASPRDGGRDASHGAARVIVLDEPTSSLSVAEVERLLAIVRQLASEGITVIYVSHRMGEIFAVCDRVSVLRDGRYIATSNVKDIDEPVLVEQMIGRRLLAHVRQPGGAHSVDPGQSPLLRVTGVSSPGTISNISVSVRAGEVVGIGGLVGSGRSELLDAIFGLDGRATGTVECAGKKIPRGRPQASIRAGLGYVPEDRKLQGLFFQLGIGENIVLPVMARLASLGLRALGKERTLIRERVSSFQIKTASTSSLPSELSGGNQQKLLIARWMGTNTRVLLLDEPTRGIDVGTKAEIYRLVREAAAKGAAVLLVSSEMPELLALSDRVIVLCGGRMTGELTGEEMTQTNILRLATQERRAAG